MARSAVGGAWRAASAPGLLAAQYTQGVELSINQRSRLASSLRHAKVNQAHLVGVAEARLGRQPREQLVVQSRRLGPARRHGTQPRRGDLLCRHGIPLTLGVD